MAAFAYPIPALSPTEMYWVCQASYEKRPRKYLEKHCVTVLYEKSAKFKDFQMILCRHLPTENYVVAFCGMHTARSVANRIRDFFIPDESLIRSMESVLSDWDLNIQRRQCKISGLYGHSAGGAFVASVLPEWDVNRVTANGDKIMKSLAGKRLVNLRLEGDPLKLKNHIKYCITVGGGGHSLEDFKQYCIGKSWNELTNGKIEG